MEWINQTWYYFPVYASVYQWEYVIYSLLDRVWRKLFLLWSASWIFLIRKLTWTNPDKARYKKCLYFLLVIQSVPWLYTGSSLSHNILLAGNWNSSAETTSCLSRKKSYFVYPSSCIGTAFQSYIYIHFQIRNQCTSLCGILILYSDRIQDRQPLQSVLI